MGYPQTEVPKTAHSVWYAYTMSVAGVSIGSFERFGARSTRTVERIREILFSSGATVVDMVWGGTDTSLDLSRVEMYTQGCIEVFGKAVYALEDLNTKFDITEVMTMPTNIGGYRSITYAGCAGQAWGRDLDVSGAKVIETMTIEVSRVYGSRSS